MPSYAVTGANRGIGFALIDQLSADPTNVVFGLVRSVQAAQEKVTKKWPERKNIHIIHGDLSDLASLESAAKYVSATTGGGLDVLIANAAAGKLDFKFIDEDIAEDRARFDADMSYHFNVNVIGNIHLINLFVPLIKRGGLKKILVVSSGMGDPNFVVEENVKMQTPYAVSKAALNMAVAKYHVQYKSEGILIMAISPGLVETGGYNSFEKTPKFFADFEAMGAIMKNYAEPDFKGPITPEESAKLVLGVMNKATIEENGGKMISHLGTWRWL